MKFALALIFVCAVTAAQAQYVPGFSAFGGAATNAGLYGGGAAFGGVSPGYFFQVVVLQAEAEKLLTKPDLPDDLRQRVLDVVTNAGTAFDSCGSMVTVLPWVQIRCAATQMKLVKNQLKAIEDEANARALAATAVSATTS